MSDKLDELTELKQTLRTVQDKMVKRKIGKMRDKGNQRRQQWHKYERLLFQMERYKQSVVEGVGTAIKVPGAALDNIIAGFIFDAKNLEKQLKKIDKTL
jgi:hypothetical protein